MKANEESQRKKLRLCLDPSEYYSLGLEGNDL